MSAGFHMNAVADEMSVRALLVDMRARLREHGLTEAACSTVEIVLAEALNNIVEHAYTGAGAGEIGLHAVLAPDSLTCTLSDQGAALPAPHLPAGYGRSRGCASRGWIWLVSDPQPDARRALRARGRHQPTYAVFRSAGT
ncbi:ATP-binding protein [Roseovarius sp. A46]|uniref:ATP-binding protein n=1 Tax=Roseovarius sp. A46 TaxID=2109331 RepID=UPI0013E98C87|nr:ATP-binding protein [Roseovarius sp. A46]